MRKSYKTQINHHFLDFLHLDIKLVLVAVTYWLAGKFGLSIPLQEAITLFWLPTGISVAALMRWGYSCWLGVYAGAFLVELDLGLSLPVAAEIAIGNTLGPMLSVLYLRRSHFHTSFDRHQDILFLCIASAFGMTISAGNGVFFLWLNGVISSPAISSAFVSWWAGDFVGVLLAAPLLLSLTPASLNEFWKVRWEFLMCCIVTVLLGWWLSHVINDVSSLAITYLTLPLVIWAALRFGIIGASLATLLLSLLAAIGTAADTGPFHALSQFHGLWILWSYVVSMLLVGLMIVALGAERRAADHDLRVNNERQLSVLNSAMDAILHLDAQGCLLYWPPQAELIFGWRSEDIKGQFFDQMIIAECSHETIRSSLQGYLSTGESSKLNQRIEIIALHHDGHEFPIELKITPIKFAQIVEFRVFIRDITQRKKDLLALQNSEERFRALFETSTAAIMTLSLEQGFLSGNPATIRLFACPDEQAFIGKDPVFFSPETQANGELSSELAKQKMEEALIHGSLTFEWLHQRLNGEIFDAVIQLDRIEINHEVQLQAVVRDITKQKRFQADLIASEDRIRGILRTMSDAVVLIDREGIILLINDAVCCLFGYSEHELLGHNVKILMPEPYFSEHDGYLKKHVETQEKVIIGRRVEVYGKCRNGELVLIELSVNELINDHGTFIGVMRDISYSKAVEKELKDAHKAAKQAEFLSNQALDLACSGHWYIDYSQGDEYYVSSLRTVEIFGDPPRDNFRYHIMNDWYVNLEAADKTLADATLANYLAAVEGTLPRYDMIHPYRRPCDGNIIWVHVIGEVIRDSDGSPTYLYGVVMDITASKVAELALIDAKETAENATKVKSEFLANMSHEIRTPINAILGFSQLALRNELPAEIRNYLNKVHISAENLLGIINDILDFSKIEAGKLAIEKIEFRVDELINQLHDIFRSMASQKGLELTIGIMSGVPNVLWGDPLRLSQVLINLLGNALKFTYQGEVSLLIYAMEQVGTSAKLTFSIQDSGVGMTEAQLSSLFNAFHQADASTTRKYGGTGLGLVISQKLVKLMGGKIAVQSKPGQGSQFTFTLEFPVLQQNQLDESQFLGKRIWVIDDSSIMRTLLVDLLEGFGCQVEDFSTGKQLEARLSLESTADLILLDWQLLDSEGLELAQQIHNLPNRTPIILISADDHIQKPQMDSDLFLDVMIKPINPLLLQDKLLELFSGKKKPPTSMVIDEKIPNLEGYRILLVDDNAFNCEVGFELIKLTGASVTIANDGQQAVDAVFNAPYDLVLMDIQMPMMDGYTATILIREQFKFLPIIALTAHAMQEERTRVLEVGMNDFVTKPIQTKQLYDALVKGLNEGAPKETTDLSVANHQSLATEVIVTNSPDALILPGFDVAIALERLDGDMDQYRRFLILFRDRNAMLLEKLIAELEAGNMDTAKRLVHTLKGSAGTIGAVNLQSAAQIVDNELKTLPTADSILTSQALSELKIQFVQVMKTLDIIN